MKIKKIAKKFIPKFFLRVYHFKLALLGAFLFCFPGYAKDIKIIGVTGTSGKSTTVDFIAKILEEAGNRVASISSVRFKIAEKEWENKYKMTMPGRFVIQRFLRQAKKASCKFVVLEVTSEGIRQFRHKFINFDAAVFTNLTPEHIESHGSFDKYREEKLKLFKVSKNIHIINADDENAKYFFDIPGKQKISFTLSDAKAANLKLQLVGDFNLYNAMAAISVGKAYGISLDICKKSLEKIKGVPGRMEFVQREPFGVVVDYAHTPEQLEAVYKSFSNNDLICVLGSCGGGRDKRKRPLLGKIASQYCKDVFITNEDPYDEDPAGIINQVAETAGPNAKKVLDRREAIRLAIDLAKTNNMVIITGKGSEPWMCIKNGKKIPWDDRQIAKEFLNSK